MSEKTLTCRDCGTEFVFTEGEQEFYKEKGFEMNQLDAQLVEKLRNNKIIEDNYKVCFLRVIEFIYNSFNFINNIFKTILYFS